MSFVGGNTFAEDDFLRLQKCMKVIGEEHFVIVENYDYAYTNYKNPGFPYKFKYPVNITWQEITSGSFVSEEVISGFGIKEYFVFGASGVWGKYSANDDIVNYHPLGILGFQPAYADLLIEEFNDHLDEEEKRTTLKFLKGLPPAYRQYDKHLH